jgi:hypothetical protein
MQYVAMAPIMWAKGAIALVALAASIPAIQLLADPLRKLLSGAPTLELADLEGWVGVTDVDKVTTTFGWAVVSLGDREDKRHLVEVRTREGVISPRGSKVLLEEFNAEQRFFLVVKVDDNFENQQNVKDSPGETEGAVEEQ